MIAPPFVDRRFGMEWELDIDRELALQVVAEVTGGTAGHARRSRANPDGSRFMWWPVQVGAGEWIVGGDPSLIRDDLPIHRCTEVSTPPLIESYAASDATWSKVLLDLNRAGARVTPRCALHVHIEALALRPVELARVVALEHDRHPLSTVRQRYAMPAPAAVLDLAQRDDCTEDELWRAWYGDAPVPAPGRDHRHKSRRRTVNLHSVRYRNTIEFRWPSMTLDPNEVDTVIASCFHVVDRARLLTAADFAPRVPPC